MLRQYSMFRVNNTWNKEYYNNPFIIRYITYYDNVGFCGA